MECRHAYLKQNIDYVLCNKEPTPNGIDRKSLFHAVCAHQVDCPKQRCHRLSSSWVRCAKLAERPQNATKATFARTVSQSAPEKKPSPRTRRKPTGEK